MRLEQKRKEQLQNEADAGSDLKDKSQSGIFSNHQS
jgi:hypothetical protein